MRIRYKVISIIITTCLLFSLTGCKDRRYVDYNNTLDKVEREGNITALSDNSKELSISDILILTPGTYSGILHRKNTEGKNIEDGKIQLKIDDKHNAELIVNDDSLYYNNTDKIIKKNNKTAVSYQPYKCIWNEIEKSFVKSLISNDAINKNKSSQIYGLQVSNETIFNVYCSLIEDIVSKYNSLYDSINNDKTLTSYIKEITGYDTLNGCPEDAFIQLGVIEADAMKSILTSKVQVQGNIYLDKSKTDPQIGLSLLITKDNEKYILDSIISKER